VMVTVLCAYMAIRFEPIQADSKHTLDEPTPFERIMQSIAAKKQQQSEYL
jgi:hypothetical protein